jgi:2-polyprenyl-3-methyl-5-hydroxy-6-metoxy-1,4-benzoquinol methylase
MNKITTAEVRSFNEKIRTSLVQIEEVACLCGSANYLPVSRWDRHGLWSPVVICKRCGLIYANPRLTEESYKVFYSSDLYRLIYEGRKNFVEHSENRYENDYGGHIFREVFPIMGERGLSTVLEFGCGGGWHLIPFVQRGFSVTGYDYSTSLIKLGRSKGLNLMEGSFDDVSGQYDLIILNHVAEHFTDFYGSMKNLCGHLNPGGILYVSVPNMDHFYRDQFQNAHTYYL